MSVDKFAPGWNNVAGLKALAELTPPYFEGLRWLKTVWNDEEAVQRDGVGGLVPIGLPYIEVQVEIISQGDLQVLRTKLCPGRRAPVTVYTYNKTLDAWKYYNGQMELYRLDGENATWELLHWRNIRFWVRELLEISP
ncbi:MAG: hypothetical protein WCZ87_00350 [Thiohalobacteraceae bacterium]